MESDQRRHYWTRIENGELVFCYYTSPPNVRGFCKQLYEVFKLWKSKKVFVVSIIIGALGSVSIDFPSYMESPNLPFYLIAMFQRIVLFRTSSILRRYLQI